MKRWFDRSIRNKIATVVLLAVLPAVLLASILGAWRETTRQITSKRSEIAGIAAALAATVSEPLASGNRRKVANALKGIASIPHLSHVGVVDSAGTNVFQFGAGIIVDDGTVGGIAQSLRTFPVEVPVVHEGREIGRLMLIADIADIVQGYARSFGVALVGGLLAALAGVLVSNGMQRAISAPIAELTATMRDVRAARDYSQSVSITSKDETGALVEAFNEMMREINERDAALAQYSQGLERQVADRTRDLAAATRAAVEANAAKSEFLASMSHEIRTPMNGILVMAELMAASDLAPRAQRHCEVILRSGQTLLSIINDILDLSKIEAGSLTLEAIPVDLEAIADDAVKLFSERATSKGLSLASYVSPDVPRAIAGDPVRLSQVVSNLVNNALKFTETGGVLVRIERVGDRPAIRCSVIDTGIGIPEDKLASIFDPFTQAEQSTTRRYGGTGIGLTICRKLVSAMGGSLTVESVPGHGSTFTFEIPLARAEAHLVERGPERSGGIVLAMPAGAARTALQLVAADLGLEVVESGSADAGEARGAVKVVVADLAHLDEAPAGAAAPIVLLAPLGDTAGEHLLGSGRIAALLELPFGSREAREALASAALGRRSEPSRPVPHRASAAVEALSFRGRRILAADDSPINREVLIEALRRLGADVTCVEDGAAAVAAVREGGFDLVFMDGSMPVLDGFDATRAIRAWEAETGRASIPVVGLSAHVIGAKAELWRDCGMSDFVTKPFTLHAIRTCLERWLVAAGADAAGGDAVGAAEASGDEDPLVDPTVLATIREMQAPGDDLVGRVLALYVQHSPRLLEALLDCAHRPEDHAALAAAAHALKSLCRNVGAMRVGNACGRVEDAAREGRSVLDAHRDMLVRDLAATIVELERLAGLSAAAPVGPAVRGASVDCRCAGSSQVRCA